jgi:AcrR family transcriptional regulator
MSPRARTVSDATILAATARMISRVGPARLTLADVGEEVGLAPATLLQRFGSKRGLLIALVQQAVESVDDSFTSVRASRQSALDAAIAAAGTMAEHVRTPEELANNLAFFQIDLSDAEFHRLALEHSRRVLAGYQSLLQEAVTVGELVECDAGALASALQAVAAGSLLNWAIHRDGPVADWVRADIETLITPYRAATVTPALTRRR